MDLLASRYMSKKKEVCIERWREANVASLKVSVALGVLSEFRLCLEAKWPFVCFSEVESGTRV